MFIDEKQIQLRWYNPEDDGELEQLVRLHHLCFPTEKWKKKDFVNFVGGTHGNNNVVKVVEDVETHRLYGTLLYTLEEGRLRLRRICVTEPVRRRGLATFMLNALCGPRSPIRRRVFTARVREANLAAQCLLRGMGFDFDGTRPRQHDANGEAYFEFTFNKDAVPA